MNQNAVDPAANRAVQIVEPDLVAHVHDHSVAPTCGRHINLQTIPVQFANGDHLVSERHVVGAVFDHHRVSRFQGRG